MEDISLESLTTPSPFAPDRNFRNPVMAAQANENVFILDDSLGFTIPKGKEFLLEDGYLSIEQCLQEIKECKKRVILNLGDSSTSGWDSNIVTINRQRKLDNLPPLSAFFQYKTYSDVLREMLDDDFYVINAGVPAHTSFQGARRLKLLMNIFKKAGIHIDIVTVYFGNNDSVWDFNRQDRDWIGRKTAFKRKYEESTSGVLTRVLPLDYQKSITQIIQLCKKNKTEVILIEPKTPIYWKPGTRVIGEGLERKYFSGSYHVYNHLDHALKLWNHIKDQPFSTTKQLLLEAAREEDFIVPRIKKSHLNMLRRVVKEQGVHFISVKLDRTVDDLRYFIDYCHPIGDANQKIAQAITELVTSSDFSDHKNAGKVISKTSNDDIQLDIPTDHYALF